jgi:hypothetical protein
MYKTLTAIAVAVVITIAAVAAPHQAEARGGRIAAGIIGGLAAGAIIGSIVANRGYYYAPGYYYGPGPTITVPVATTATGRGRSGLLHATVQVL